MSAPALLLAVGAVVEWGWYFSQQVLVEEAARDAVRAGASAAAGADHEGLAEARARSALDAAGFDGDAATVTASLASTGGLEVLEVQLAVPHPSLVSLVPVLSDHAADAAMFVDDP